MADLSSLFLYTPTENGLFSHMDDTLMDWQSIVVVTVLVVCLSNVCVVFSDFYDGTVLASGGKG